MKTVRLILWSVFIIILLQSTVNAETTTTSLRNFQKKFLQLNKDFRDFGNTKKDLYASTHDLNDRSDWINATTIRGELSTLQEYISHLYDLVSIRNILTNKSELDFVKSLINEQIKFMDNDINDTIELINKLASVSNSPSFVSLSDQVKEEARKLQGLLKNID